MQEVVPSAVAMAVRILISICTAHFMVSFFIANQRPSPPFGHLPHFASLGGEMVTFEFLFSIH